jgi:hypothetical protein
VFEEIVNWEFLLKVIDTFEYSGKSSSDNRLHLRIYAKHGHVGLSRNRGFVGPKPPSLEGHEF